MSRPDGPPVVDCISAVVTTYVDAANLIQRIKRTNNRPLPEDALASLEISLALGPPIVQGQYDLDVRRIGQKYVYGDETAREDMRIILTGLQATLLVGLQRALTENLDLDYDALQASSDNSRVSSIVCLNKLGQRLGPSITPKPKVSIPSTPTSGSVEMPVHGEMSDPESSRSSVAQSISSGDTKSHTACSLSPIVDSENLSTPNDLVSPIARERGASLLGERRPLPYLLKGTVELPSNEIDAFEANRQQYSASPASNNRNNGTQYQIPTIKESSGDKGALNSPSTTAPQSLGPRSFPAPSSTPGLGYQPYRPNLDPSEQMRNKAAIPLKSQPAPSAPIPPPDMWRFKHRPSTPTPDEPPRSLFVTTPRSNFFPGFRRRALSTSGSSGTSTLVPENDTAPLYLPSEENRFAGFCKGAWKLQTGARKAMRSEQRPSGMFSSVLFWRCCKCNFEGPMNLSADNPPSTIMHSPSFSRTTPLDQPSRSFDHRVKVHPGTGIRYRWAFLAKSHAFCKKVPPTTDGSTCSYGCIYCCAEQKGPAPIFGNVDAFMQHLRTHDGESLRGHKKAPQQELLNRTKCIMGRLAQDWEEFDINIPPVMAEVQG
ncbi:hypothetical protein AJ79_05327 [Helicocarpus griseus UAMH5409]|uniref:Uncharacterized protein n=1 Tax=Helicocarpus griseus UAMH5409 TaxID=1447875 RepID=A0A2B7XNK0_9EURO|nr:hypothetical protein AJ79_05327 [Helicocarpus griseus UAMH5409]